MDDATFDARYSVAPKVFRDWMKGKLDLADATILDFGADTGVMALGLAQHCRARRVIGVDINENYKNLLNECQGRLGLSELPANLEFHLTRADEPLSETFADTTIDCVFSWSVFEHVARPILPTMAAEVARTLRPGGYAFIQIAPLYYSAHGSHLDMLVPEPWAHLTMQLNLFEDRIRNAEKAGPYAGETDANFALIREALWSTFATLNRVTADELIALFTDAGLTLTDEYRTKNDATPPAALRAVYNEDVLRTEQIVCLFQKN